MIDRHQSWVAWTACVAGSVILIVALFFAIKFGALRSHEKKVKAYQSSVQVAAKQSIESLGLSAKGVLVYDATSHVALYQKKADTVFPIASITKMGTAITALAYAEPDSLIQLSSPVTAALDPAVILPAGSYSVADVVRFMIATSSNDAASALAVQTVKKADIKTERENYFPVLVSETLGLADIIPWYAGTPNGLDSPYEPTVYASAQSIAMATLHFVHTYPEIAALLNPNDTYTVTAQNGSAYQFSHTLKHDGAVPRQIVFAKTGYTDDASGSLVFIMRHEASEHMIVVVLLDVSRDLRLREATQIINALNSVLL